jgi:hypothetical protein
MPRRTSYRHSGFVTAKIFRSLTLLVLPGLVACVKEPVDWGDVSYRNTQLGDPLARSMVMSANLPTVSGTAAPCLRSIVSVNHQPEIFRAWWAVRSDSNGVLSMQRSPDGGLTWQSPVTVDDRDRGRGGCDRPSPALAYDSTSKYIYLAYFLGASDGAGVFFAHSMDDGRMFHSPVPVVYGNNPAHAGVVGHGDSVVVVFEDPNSTTPRLGIVLSSTTGHIFEQRGEVTPEEVPAILPWVSLQNNRVSVWWMTSDARDRVGHREGVWK